MDARRFDLSDPWPEATLKLIDALRGYIRTVEDAWAELEEVGVSECFGQTRLMAQEQLGPYRALLALVEKQEVDPCLQGLLPWPRRGLRLDQAGEWPR